VPSRRAVALVVTAALLTTGWLVTVGSSVAAAAGNGGGFAAVSPSARLLDTRTSGGCVSGPSGRSLLVGGFGGVPSGAAAVVVNVTVVSPSAPGYVTVYPAGQAPPTASSLNYVAGQTVPNQVTVKLGTAGAIVLFASGGCPNLVVDVQGWFAAGPAGTGGFEGVTPARVRDTRLVGGCLVGNETRSITVGGVGAVPSSANAVVLNVTAVTPTAGGNLTVYPTGRPTPLASSLNFTAGRVVPNAVTVGLGTGDSIAVFNGSGGCTHVVVDVVGYYAGSGDSVVGGFVDITPTRSVDTRVTGGCIPAQGSREVAAAGVGDTASDSLAVALNVTVVAPGGPGYLTVHPAGGTKPTVSNLNFTSGLVAANSVHVGAGTSGRITVFNGSGVCAHVVVDVIGAYVTATTPPVNAPPVISSFTASPTTVAAPGLVAYSWNVTDPEGDPLTCTIDGNGDGNVDVTVANCQNPGSRNVTVATAGSVTAALGVSDGSGSDAATTSVTVGADPVESYNIELRYHSSISPAAQAAFDSAVARWQATIVRGVPSATVSLSAGQCSGANGAISQVVDDMVIDVTVTAIDGVGGVLGQAGPCSTAVVDGLPRFGVMKFDSADVDNLLTDGRFGAVTLHEMAHVLGFGGSWPAKGLLDDTPSDPRFTGARGNAEWSRMGGTGTVPVEAGGGLGTAKSHWRETVFDKEIMTGFLDASGNVLSRLSIASMADLGYQVDITTADAYTLPSLLSGLRSAGPSVVTDEQLTTLPVTPVQSVG